MGKDCEKILMIQDLLSNENITAEEIRKYADAEDADIREAIARHKNCPADVLKKLSKDRNKKVRQAVAENRNTPAEVLSEMLVELFRPKPVNRLVSLLRNPNLDADALRLVFEKTDKIKFLNLIAEHPNTPADVLKKLADYPNYRVKKRVARNPNTPIYILHMLANNCNAARKDVIKNPNVSKRTLELLAPYYKEAKEKLKMMEESGRE